jgi:hypothetical protein
MYILKSMRLFHDSEEVEIIPFVLAVGIILYNM